ncbi:uncharacterized protein V1516DRAFT_680762 [Lipomyces oligophaga]|uniref:uncharacterized protein n=1 Tax=Lipomyces oligophaga TaxID=45792 RepID=UPI0034CEDDEB
MSAATKSTSKGGSPEGSDEDHNGIASLLKDQDVDADDLAAILAEGNDGAVGGDATSGDGEADGEDAENADDVMLALSGEVPDLGTDERELVAHAEDAVDYEDEAELADDEEDEVSDQQSARDTTMDDGADANDWLDSLDDNVYPNPTSTSNELDQLPDELPDNLFDNEESVPELPDELVMDIDQQLDDIQTDPSLELPDDFQVDMVEMGDLDLEFEINSQSDVLPSLKPERPLRMSIFVQETARLTLPEPTNIKACYPTRVNLDADKDQSKVFRSHLRLRNSVYERPGVIQIRAGEQSSKRRRYRDKSERRLTQAEEELIFACYDWESKIIWDSDSDISMDNNAAAESKRHKNGAQAISDDIYWVDDDDYVDGVDDEAIINGNLEEQAKKVVLDLNDPMLFVDAKRPERSRKKVTGMGEELLKKRYNISNDQAYDLLKENYQSRVRSTIGNLSIDHSMVAIRLQSPYYKVKLSKSQARSFHRPMFVTRPNVVIRFSKMRHRKKKKDKGKDASQIFAHSKDLSLGDGSNYVLLEYSEEFPMAMSNFGMGSKIINYYRKKASDDENRPKLSIGETYVLGTEDRSPFWNFGSVDKGEIVPTYYNRLVRAPIFRHETNETDFLMVRGTGGGEGQKYFLRSIPHLFCVGQTFPVTEIPSPRSRRVTTASKNRLKMIVYRVLSKADKERILVKGISSHFPDQNDMQNRQRLKEFMEYQRAGDDQGFWKIKPTDTLPNEDGIRSMVSCEEITLLETMQVGQQFLEDQGLGGGKEDDEQHEGMTIEEKLAPWITSKNFINATQGKAMLELHGEGDPTGCGLAFSFVRTSMKGGFKSFGSSADEKIDKSKFGGHSYNVALQQKAYEQEIVRIWAAQKKDLTAPPASGELKS